METGLSKVPPPGRCVRGLLSERAQMAPLAETPAAFTHRFGREVFTGFNTLGVWDRDKAGVRIGRDRISA